MSRFLLFLGVVMLLWFSAAEAASLSGRVTDEGEPLPLAEVSLVNAASHILQGNLFSDADGRFHFSVPAGRYHLSVEKEEYANADVRDIVVEQADVVQNIELLPEVFAEQEASSEDCD